MHDSWAVLVAASVGQIRFIEEPLMLYRIHSDNNVGVKKSRTLKYCIEKMRSQDIHRLYSQYYAQAELLYERCAADMHPEAKEAVLAFIGMRKKGKLKRIFITFKYRFLKTSFLRRLGQLWYV